MPVTEAERHRLHLALDGALGETDAAVLMSHLPPSGWSDVARRQDLDELEARVTTRFEHSEARWDERFTHFEARMDERFARMDERFATFEARMDERFARMDERFADFEARMDERFARMDERFERFDERFTLTDAKFERSLAVALKDQTNRTIVALVAIITSVGTMLQILSG
jgi:hypothetical protein